MTFKEPSIWGYIIGSAYPKYDDQDQAGHFRVVDLNGDDRLDIVWGALGSQGHLYASYQRENPPEGYTVFTPPYTVFKTTDATNGDFTLSKLYSNEGKAEDWMDVNNDSIGDYVFSPNGDYLYYFKGEYTDGGQSWDPQMIRMRYVTRQYRNNTLATYIPHEDQNTYFHDLNGDGAIDRIMLDSYGLRFNAGMSKEDGRFFSPITIPMSNDFADMTKVSLSFRDLNNDGIPEIFATNGVAMKVYFMMDYDGAIRPTGYNVPGVSSLIPDDYTSIDADRNGSPDIVYLKDGHIHARTFAEQGHTIETITDGMGSVLEFNFDSAGDYSYTYMTLAESKAEYLAEGINIDQSNYHMLRPTFPMHRILQSATHKRSGYTDLKVSYSYYSFFSSQTAEEVLDIRK